MRKMRPPRSRDAWGIGPGLWARRRTGAKDKGEGARLVSEESSPRFLIRSRASGDVGEEMPSARPDVELTSIGRAGHLSCCPSFDGENAPRTINAGTP